MRFFNTAGPIKPRDHYCLSPLVRIKLDEIVPLIDQEKYFVLHAPRQTGKTSCLLALLEHLNSQGRYRCVYVIDYVRDLGLVRLNQTTQQWHTPMASGEVTF